MILVFHTIKNDMEELTVITKKKMRITVKGIVKCSFLKNRLKNCAFKMKETAMF